MVMERLGRGEACGRSREKAMITRLGVVAAATLLCIGTAEAQHHGGHHHGGGGGGGGTRTFFAGSGMGQGMGRGMSGNLNYGMGGFYGLNSGYSGYNSGYGRGGYGRGGYGRGGYGGFGGGYGMGGYGMGAYGLSAYGMGGYGMPYYGAGYSQPRLPLLPPPTPFGGGFTSDTAKPGPGTIAFNVPENALVWVDRELLSQTGPQREFSIDNIPAHTIRPYNVRVQWIEKGEERSYTQRVYVKPNARASVTVFSRPTALPLPK
jgi:hypothetical protein